MDQKQSQPSRTKEEKNAFIQEWQASGLSKKQFTESKGINYMTFIGWFSRGSGKKSARKKFIPIQIPASASGVFAELILSNQRKIVLHQAVSAEFLQLLLKC